MPSTYPYSDSGLPPVTSDTPAYDPWAVLSFLAAGTTTIRLATNIYILPLRHPLQTARAVVTVDRLSGGRVTLGVGVGWMEEEFSYVGLPFHDRGLRADSIIGILRRLWIDDVTEVHDEHFDFGPVKFQPKPLQKPAIPIEVGGASGPALRRAGTMGDGWIEIGSKDIDDFTAKLAVVLEARRGAGRRGPFEVTVSGGLAPSVDGYRRLRDAGATRIMVGPGRSEGRPRPQDWIEWSERFAEEVVSRVDE